MTIVDCIDRLGLKISYVITSNVASATDENEYEMKMNTNRNLHENRNSTNVEMSTRRHDTDSHTYPHKDRDTEKQRHEWNEISDPASSFSFRRHWHEHKESAFKKLSNSSIRLLTTTLRATVSKFDLVFFESRISRLIEKKIRVYTMIIWHEYSLLSLIFTYADCKSRTSFCPIPLFTHLVTNHYRQRNEQMTWTMKRSRKNTRRISKRSTRYVNRDEWIQDTVIIMRRMGNIKNNIKTEWLRGSLVTKMMKLFDKICKDWIEANDKDDDHGSVIFLKLVFSFLIIKPQDSHKKDASLSWFLLFRRNATWDVFPSPLRQWRWTSSIDGNWTCFCGCDSSTVWTTTTLNFFLSHQRIEDELWLRTNIYE